ncbi:hypothetical protein D3C84_1277000 [compost metagenome]
MVLFDQLVVEEVWPQSAVVRSQFLVQLGKELHLILDPLEEDLVIAEVSEVRA